MVPKRIRSLESQSDRSHAAEVLEFDVAMDKPIQRSKKKEPHPLSIKFLNQREIERNADNDVERESNS